MQFWCSARNTAWTWEWTPYPGVWLFIALCAWLLVRWNRAGARAAGTSPRPFHPLSLVGLLLLWVALDWPVGALGSGYLASVHMVQFLLIGLLAPVALLGGVSPEAAALLDRLRRGGIFERLSRPTVALIVFNAVVLFTHLPPVVDGLMSSANGPVAAQLGSMLIDLLWLAGGLLFWWPVMLESPRRERFVPPLRMLYLVVGLMFSPVMFGLVGFMVNAEHPLYGLYELAPPFPTFTSRDDHQLAGALMSLTGATVAFIGLSVIFFRWSKDDG